MKTNRRLLMKSSVVAATALFGRQLRGEEAAPQGSRPCFVSTWRFGLRANDRALEVLGKTTDRMAAILDAIEQGIHIIEADEANASVGIGGTPNANGVVQLDACFMDGVGHRAGSVAAVEDILHPISAARLVMERTKHVMLVGDDARQFALENGLEARNLLTENRVQAWRKWQMESAAERARQAAAGPDNHDTIALLGVDAHGRLAGGCSTSGMGYKVPGRVGDSPIIGSGLYVDNEVGAAGATGIGENVMRYCASFIIVEAMARGASPTEACVDTIKRIARKDPRSIDELHINFVALSKSGIAGAAGTDKGFQYAVTTESGSRVLEPTIVG